MHITKKWYFIYFKNAEDLQSDQTGEALEDIYVQAADAVVGQVSETQGGKKVSGLFLSHFRNNSRQL